MPKIADEQMPEKTKTRPYLNSTDTKIKDYLQRINKMSSFTVIMDKLRFAFPEHEFRFQLLDDDPRHSKTGDLVIYIDTDQPEKIESNFKRFDEWWIKYKLHYKLWNICVSLYDVRKEHTTTISDALRF